MRRGDRADAVRDAGPAVSTARPGVRVSLAHASAANVADCSCRVSMMRTPCFTAASYSGQMCPPFSVNIVVDAEAAQRGQRQLARVARHGAR